MGPYRLRPILKTRPWGVRSLAPWLPDAVGESPVGEAWYTADESGLDGGTTLGAAIAADPGGMLGAGARGPCPLLLKLLFTSERLSVQVHPDDEYASVHHGSLGKTEAWHVLEAMPGAELALGFTRAIGRDEAVAAAQSGAIERLISWRPTAAGDTWLVPAQTVHAIGAGLTIIEVQEHSDLTYRLYDYGRPRELHLERGFEVADLGPYTIENTRVAIAPGRERLVACTYFTIERWSGDGGVAFAPGARAFHLLVVTAGEGALDGRATRAGDAWFVPAASEGFRVHLPGGTLLVAYPGAAPSQSFAR